ncbi:MAG: 3-dehydroquinate synthase [Paraclostridium sp.]
MEKNIVIESSYENFSIGENYDKVLILTDERVYKSQLESFIRSVNYENIEVYTVKSGEESKSINTYQEVIEFCLRINLTRKSLLIAFGGGVVGDLGGFVASTYMRGIDLIQVPTTLLAQVDSSVGGKTAINIGNIKNMVGTFYQPKKTYINVNSLQTLAKEEYLSGIGEVVKYGFIYDYEFLKYINKNIKGILNKNEDILKYIVKKCTDIKYDIVSQDEKESGLRKILNLGHTFGHGIEKICNLNHGFAVNIGTHMAFLLALEKKLIDKDYYDEFIQISKELKLPVVVKYDNSNDILEMMKSDKKNSFGNINLVLPIGKGSVDVFNNIENEDIIKVIKGCLNA